MKYSNLKWLGIGLLAFVGFVGEIFAQIEVSHVSSVDTSDREIQAVFNHWKGYLNARPDSTYDNPYWDTDEVAESRRLGLAHFDRSAQFLFKFGLSAERYFSYFKPKVLSIEKYKKDVFKIKTIFETCQDWANKPDFMQSPMHIVSVYCKKIDSRYYLQNGIRYEVEHWKKVHKNFINYFVHPACDFDEREANKAVKFCKQIRKKFKLDKIEPIFYYITPNSEALGRLNNFDYKYDYNTGLANMKKREIAVSKMGPCHYHEFIHVLFPLEESNEIKRPKIVTEGLATWLGGASGSLEFEKELMDFSKEIQFNDTLLLSDILDNSYFHPLDNIPLYVSGGFICKIVYEKYSVAGVKKLYSIGKEDWIPIIEELFEMKYDRFDEYILDEIRKVSN